MQTTPVRESSLRNVHGDTLRKELCYYNMSIQLSAPRCITANSKYFAVPWTKAGNFGAFDFSATGKVPDICPLVAAHQSAILALAMSPHKETYVASGARESVIKIWDIAGQTVKNPIKEPVQTLNEHSKRILGLYYNPYISDLLLSTSGDDTAKLWDLTKGKSSHTLNAYGGDSIVSEWSSNGTILNAAAGGLSVYDPRASPDPTLKKESPHGNKKGFQACWMGSAGEKICTTGWQLDKREIMLWDTRSFDKPMGKAALDKSASYLLPFYDEGTGLLFLIEKGTIIFFYEITQADPFVYEIGKYPTDKDTTKAKTTFSSGYMFPKRVCDVMKCEVARFLRVNKDEVEVNSFYVPRKATAVFQEDLFPPSFAEGPSQDIDSFLEGKTVTPKKISLRPENVKSVYEVSKEEGGRSKKVDTAKKAGKTAQEIKLDVKSEKKAAELSSGVVDMLVKGFFWSTWVQHTIEIKKGKLIIFAGSDATPTRVVLGSDITAVKSGERNSFIVTEKQADLSFRAQNDTEKDIWIKALQRLQNAQPTAENATLASPRGSLVDKEIGSAEAEVPAELVDLPSPEGFLDTLEYGYLWNHWSKSYWRLDKDFVLHKYSSESSSNSIEQIHLHKVIAIHPTENESDLTFKIATPTRAWTLKCSTLEEVKDWTNALELVKRSLKSAGSEEGISYGEGLVIQHWLLVKVGYFSWGSRYYCVAVGDEILCYKSETDFKPYYRYPLLDITGFESPVDAVSEKTFAIRVKDGTRSHFTCSSREERDEYSNWYSEVVISKSASNSLNEELGIDADALEKISEKTLEAQIKGQIMWIDVKAGTQPVFVQVMGRKRTRTKLVEASVASMQSGGCFVLDCGNTIYQWYGAKSNRFQQAKALDIASRTRMKEKGGGAKIVKLLEGKEDDVPAFWKVVGNKSKIPTTVVDGLEEDKIANKVVIYKIFTQKITKIHSGKPPSYKVLRSNSVYVVQNGAEVWTWVGRSSSREDRKMYRALVAKLQSQITGWTCHIQVGEESETVLFKENFCDFPGQLLIAVTQQPLASNVAVKKEQTEIDLKKMFFDVRRDKDVLYDQGTGQIEIWRVENFGKVDFSKESYGHFWSADSYLLLYKYKEGNSERYLFYFWQGRDCSINEKGTSAYLTKEMNDLAQGQSTQIRVVQYQERSHWFKMLHEYYVIHEKNFNKDWVDSEELFEVRSGTDGYVRCVQVAKTFASLHSWCCFILTTSEKVFIWCGSGCFKHEQETTTNIATKIAALKDRTVAVLIEGEEPEEFIQPLGGRADYWKPTSSRPTLKLFEISSGTGAVDVEIVADFCQDSLNNEKVMIIDAMESVWVWFGFVAKNIEEKWALDAAIRYAETKGPHTPVHLTKAYLEPDTFKRLFQAWKQPNKIPNSVAKETTVLLDGREAYKDYIQTVFTFEQLTQKTLPKGVDPTKKEHYLGEEEFKEIFGMTKEEYSKKPKWKTEDLKKKVGLY